MTLGAAWNASLDTPITDEEADRVLDEASKDEYLAAIERDQTVADDAIRTAGDIDEGGVLRDMNIGGHSLVPSTGESLTIRVERELTRRRGELRARAAIPRGTDVGFGPARDAIDFEPLPSGRKAAKYISVTVAEGGGYKVIRRRGRYLITNPAGKTVESGTNLALLLLIFALLEKRRRDEKAKQEVQASRESDEVHLGRWVTINGVHVFIENGVITKGPDALVGTKRDGPDGGKRGREKLVIREDGPKPLHGREVHDKTRDIIFDIADDVRDLEDELGVDIKIHGPKIAGTGSGYMKVEVPYKKPVEVVYSDGSGFTQKSGTLEVRVANHSTGNRKWTDYDPDTKFEVRVWHHAAEESRDRLKKRIREVASVDSLESNQRFGGARND